MYLCTIEEDGVGMLRTVMLKIDLNERLNVSTSLGL